MKSVLFIIFKKIVNIINDFRKNKIIKNYYKTDFDKNVLICHITFPFTKKKQYFNHTNFIESLKIAEAFNKIGYNCDVVNSTSNIKIDLNKYSIIFGSGNIFLRSYFKNDLGCKRIFYGPGMHPHENNLKTLKRIKQHFLKNGKLLLASSRYLTNDYLIQTILVDGIIVLGDENTANSYKNFFDGKIEVIAPPFYNKIDYNNVIKDKNFSEAKKNFLFMSGSGMIHKGLDLLLDYFSENQSLNLHICAPINFETEFKDFYKEKLKKNNIFNYGFVDINSELFLKLLKKCAFVIFPSCSEGGGVSVITAMGNGGLIPIATKESSIKTDKLGILIKDYSVKDISDSIELAININEAELLNKSIFCAQETIKLNSIDEFSKNIFLAIKSIIEK